MSSVSEEGSPTMESLSPAASTPSPHLSPGGRQRRRTLSSAHVPDASGGRRATQVRLQLLLEADVSGEASPPGSPADGAVLSQHAVQLSGTEEHGGYARRPTPPTARNASRMSRSIYRVKTVHGAAEECASGARKGDQLHSGARLDGYLQHVAAKGRAVHEWQRRWCVCSGCVLAVFDDDSESSLAETYLLGGGPAGERDAHVIYGPLLDKQFGRRFMLGLLTHLRGTDFHAGAHGATAGTSPTEDERHSLPPQATAIESTATDSAGPRGTLGQPEGIQCAYFQCADEEDLIEWVAVLRAQCLLSREMPATSLHDLDPVLLERLRDDAGAPVLDPTWLTPAGPSGDPLHDITLEGNLGSGSFGAVRLGKHAGTGASVAIKICTKPAAEDTRLVKVLRNEIVCLERLKKAGSHPNVVSLVALREDVHNAYIIQEVAPGAELREFIEEHSQAEGQRLAAEARAAAAADPAAVAAAAGGSGGARRRVVSKRPSELPCVGLGEEASKLIVFDVSAAVLHLHQHGIVHRDMKPENVQRGPDGRAVLLDFGFARLLPPDVELPFHETAGTVSAPQTRQNTLGLNFGGSAAAKSKAIPLKAKLETLSPMGDATAGERRLEFDEATSEPLMRTMFGTKYAAPPEIWRKEPYTRAADAWGIGIIAYMVLMGREPFSDFGGAGEHAQRIMRANFQKTEPAWSSLSEDARSFVEGLLRADPRERMMPEDALAHNWLADVRAVSARGATASSAIERYESVEKRRTLRKGSMMASMRSASMSNIDISGLGDSPKARAVKRNSGFGGMA